MNNTRREVSCDDCYFAGRYSSKEFAKGRASTHAKKQKHRTRVLAIAPDVKETVYDYRPKPKSSGSTKNGR
jgi:hypothetical protein